MTIDTEPQDPATDAAVAQAMRGLGGDIYGVMSMALITSHRLEELLELQAGGDDDGEVYHLVAPRMLIDNQKWATEHVWQMARKLMARFEAAYQGVETA